MTAKTELEYLASPYSHTSALYSEWRYRKVCELAAERMRRYVVFSPIAHSHPIATIGEAPGPDWTFWAGQDLAMLSRCDALTVACMPGWRNSKGVRAEIDYARSIGIPVRYTRPIKLDLEI